MDMWNDICKPNSIGSDGGTIIADEEYKESCRITLERCERYDASIFYEEFTSKY